MTGTRSAKPRRARSRNGSCGGTRRSGPNWCDHARLSPASPAVDACGRCCRGPAGGAVPSPESHFGHKIGADRTVLDWDRVVSYFQALARSSDRILVKELGKSTEGRPFIAVTVASPNTIKQARPLCLDPEEARRSAHHAGRRSRKAHRGRQGGGDDHLLDPRDRNRIDPHGHRTRPSPAGQRHRAHTHHSGQHDFPARALAQPGRHGHRHAAGIARRSARRSKAPRRPSCTRSTSGTTTTATGISSRKPKRGSPVSQLHNVWHPQIVYDVHQQGPYASRMFVPPWMDPIEPNIDPILAQQCNMIGAGMAADLTAAGKTGVVVNALYDFWSPGAPLPGLSRRPAHPLANPPARALLRRSR